MDRAFTDFGLQGYGSDKDGAAEAGAATPGTLTGKANDQRNGRVEESRAMGGSYEKGRRVQDAGRGDACGLALPA